ncbi:ImmA/IrrE family metallo-endopeptidase [Mesorhizobium sp. B2-4-13]|uniref:helix-turn-helix domain-containing protein n=1 Tax=Mesorhizobium sp. B2-4-13 TaxID=2589936 RepID=UPI0011517859|nr:helix-turn-helix transcriptional regulator [Mesorhizobium sp. B2-4-13]TPK87046.1 ImmA/IrrE family metallo-endopeptidase [Mesorhizobium sp. B2-4-13]
MAPSKLFVGRKIRELREANKATQAVFAERLGISTSYLNQIENNQRAVSASVLLSLADKFRVDLSAFSSSDSDRLLSALKEALADPLFDVLSPGSQELKLVAQSAPAIAHALLACHQAYRRNSEQLASIDDQMVRTESFSEPTPYEEVRDFFHFVDNYIDDLDLAAECLANDLRIGEQDGIAAMAEHLETRHDVRIASSGEDSKTLRRYDGKARVLYLNPYLDSASRAFQLAFQISALERRTEVDAIIARACFRTAEAGDICRIGLCNYFAGALVLPYGRFLATAKEVRHDIELLAARFGASLEQVAHRLSTLQRPGQKGVPVFFARIDRAGNITKRHSAAKLQFARYGAACPLWNAYEAFESPGRFVRQLAEMPDGARYLSIATEISRRSGGFAEPQRRYVIALGCDVSHSSDFVYADGLSLSGRNAFQPIGISCRICERTNCDQRAVPPLKRRLSIDPDSRANLPYAIV